MRKSGTGKTHIFKKAHRYIFSLSLSQVNLTSSCVNQLYINNSKSYTLDRTLLWIIVFITTFDKHFYDEADIEVGKPIDCNVVVNHTVELTEEEKAEARQQAIKRAEDEAYAKMKQQRERAAAKRTAAVQQVQPSLFDF